MGNSTELTLTIPKNKVLDFSKDSNFSRPYKNKEFPELEDKTGVVIKWGEYGSEYYSLTEKPAAGRYAVKVAMKEALQDIDLPAIASNLESGSMLLNVAYRALDLTGSIQNDIAKIRSEYEKAVRESESVIVHFKDISTKVLDAIVQSNKDLLTAGNEKKAYKDLLQCEVYASGMAASAAGLVKTFADLQTKVEDATEKVVLLRNEKAKESAVQKKAFNDNVAKIKGLQAATKQLQTNLVSYQNMYNDLQKKIDALEDKAWKLELGGMIVKTLGQVVLGVGQAAASRNSVSIDTGKQPAPGADADGTTGKAGGTPGKKGDSGAKEEEEDPGAKQKRDDLEAKKKELDQKTKEYTAAYDKVIALESELNQIKGFVSPKAGVTLREQTVVEMELETAKKEKDALAAEKATLQTTVDSVQGQYNSYIAGGVQGLGAGLKSLAEDAKETAATYQDLVRQKSEKLDKILELKVQIESTLVTNLGSIAEYTQALKNTKDSTDDLAIVINALQIANTSLNMIVAILISIADFWTKMQVACERLASPDLRTRIKSLSEDDWSSRTEIVESYKTDDMLGAQLFLTLIRWYTILLVCDDYISGAEKGRAKILEDLTTPIGSRKEMIERAQSIAAEVEKKLGVQIVSKQQKVEDLEEQQRMNKTIKDLEADSKKLEGGTEPAPASGGK